MMRKAGDIVWSRVLLYSFSGFIMLLEKAALAVCFSQYMWMGKGLMAWLTLALCLPATAVQLLSLKWHITDGVKIQPALILRHCLHFGIYHRLWSCMKCRDGQMKFGEFLLRQADVSALCLIESLSLSLSQSLLQTYALFTLQAPLHTAAALCVVLSLLNVSWFLALYSRSCFLLRPGHLHMTFAAMMCQLMWRGGLLGARVVSLMFFSSTFHWWACGVVGFHWLIMTFWIVSQQTDVCINRGSWRLFNVILGIIHIFLFFNVKDSPSRYRMAGFYVVMLVENTVFLLLASDSLSGPSWDSMTVPLAVLSSYLTGVIFVILHYRFLHPKSTEILHSLRLRMSLTSSNANIKDTTSGWPTQRHGTFSLTGFTLENHAGDCSLWPLEGAVHHRHCLIHLALKTGNQAKIKSLYGNNGLSAFLGNDDVPVSDSGLKFKQQPLVVCELSQASGHVPETKEESSGTEEKEAVYNTCTADCSSSVYFSAEAQVSQSIADGTLDPEGVTAISPIGDGASLHLNAHQLLNRKPCYTSTPIADLKTLLKTSPRLGAARRQVHF